MQPLLIPVGHPDEQLANLLQGVIIRQYSYGGLQYFFTVYPESTSEIINIDTSKRYLVVLNSVDGTQAFYLEQDPGGDFVKEAEAYWDEPAELTTEKMIMQVDGVHIQSNEMSEESTLTEVMYGHDDDPEPIEGPEYKEANLRLVHWFTNGSEDLVLPLINAAIKEYYDLMKMNGTKLSEMLE